MTVQNEIRNIAEKRVDEASGRIMSQMFELTRGMMRGLGLVDPSASQIYEVTLEMAKDSKAYVRLAGGPAREKLIDQVEQVLSAEMVKNAKL